MGENLVKNGCVSGQSSRTHPSFTTLSQLRKSNNHNFWRHSA